MGLGAYALLCTEVRVLFVRAGTWEQSWQVPWPRLKGVEMHAERSRVQLQLFGSGLFAGQLARVIDCSNEPAMQLVYREVQRLRAEYTQALVEHALATDGSATRLSSAVRGR